jgi:hypothetical protein
MQRMYGSAGPLPRNTPRPSRSPPPLGSGTPIGETHTSRFGPNRWEGGGGATGEIIKSSPGSALPTTQVKAPIYRQQRNETPIFEMGSL